MCTFITHNPQRQQDYQHTRNILIGLPLCIEYFFPLCNSRLLCLQFFNLSTLCTVAKNYLCFFPKALTFHIKLYEINILQMTCSSCCFPSPSPTLHFPLKLFSVPLGKSTDWYFPLKQKARKCCTGKDKVHSHADHITPLSSGSSGILSSQLKLRNQELNDCLHKVKFLKHRVLKTEVTGAEGD